MAAQPSLIRIVNRAAIWLGTAQRISSLDDPAPLAEAARDTIDFCRDELLASHPWNFAIANRTTAQVPGADSDRYARAFERPADGLRFLPARPDQDWGGFDVIEQGPYLLTDAPPPLKTRWIVRVEDPSRWSPGFTHAMSAALAFEIFTVITGSDAMSQKLAGRLEAAIRDGKRQDGMASGNRARLTARLSSWLGARDMGGRELQYGPPII